MGNRALFYDSTKVQDTICAFLFKNLYPSTGDLYNTAGLDTAAIDALIGTVTNATQLSVFAVADIGTNPPSGNLVAGQIATLNTKLSTVPGADSATRQIQTITASTQPNLVKNKVLVMWESIYPTRATEYPKMLQLIGRRYMYNVLLSSTSTAASGASTMTDSTVTLNVDSLSGYYIETTGGTGSGQIRKILSNTATVYTVDTPWTTALDNTTTYVIRNYVQSVSIAVGGDTGSLATAGGANTITLGTATWTTNQFANYSVRIVSGTGANQELLIRSNTATALTVVKNWAVAPDNTSRFQIVFYTYQNLDVVPYSEAISLVATAGGANTIADSTQIWPTNVFTGYLVRTTAGTGSGQIRYIASNTSTVLTTTNAWAVNPAAGTIFDIVKLGGNWPYELADFYLNLAIPIYLNDPTDLTLMEQFSQITGLVSEDVAITKGRNQNLVLMQDLIDKGQVIYTSQL